MKIVLLGTGRMGQAVKQLALRRGDTVVAEFNAHSGIGAEVLPADANVAIDFSTADAVLHHARVCCAAGLPLVIGTTGWNEQREDLEHVVAASDSAVLYGANFSIGVAILTRALRAVLPVVDRLDAFDIYLHETHHIGKADSPSGTALRLAGDIVGTISRKTHVETETQHGRIDPSALHVSSTRAGSVFGRHTVGIEGPHDRIVLSHEATGREGFAAGALESARWLIGRKGLFTLDDFLTDFASAPQADVAIPHNNGNSHD